jgi:hypothetical protein
MFLAIGKVQNNEDIDLESVSQESAKPTRTKIIVEESPKKSFWPTSKSSKTHKKLNPIKKDKLEKLDLGIQNGKYNEIPQLLDGFRMVIFV